MEIVFTKTFKKEFARLPANVQSAAQAILEKLKNAAVLEMAGVDYVRIHGQKAGHNYYRIRIGRYRMGIEYLAPDVIIVTIAARGRIYKTFPPK